MTTVEGPWLGGLKVDAQVVPVVVLKGEWRFDSEVGMLAYVAG